jgi:hypothetical protein
MLAFMSSFAALRILPREDGRASARMAALNASMNTALVLYSAAILCLVHAASNTSSVTDLRGGGMVSHGTRGEDDNEVDDEDEDEDDDEEEEEEDEDDDDDDDDEDEDENMLDTFDEESSAAGAGVGVAAGVAAVLAGALEAVFLASRLDILLEVRGVCVYDSIE